MDKLLTEPEVAKILRCHRSKVKRLRLAGKLAYLVGRPVLIRETDLEAYIEGQTRRQEAKERATKPQVKAARQWALEQILLKRRRS